MLGFVWLRDADTSSLIDNSGSNGLLIKKSRSSVNRTLPKSMNTELKTRQHEQDDKNEIYGFHVQSQSIAFILSSVPFFHHTGDSSLMAAPARPINKNWQQPEVPLVPIGATTLVLPSHDWPASVAYCFSSDIRIFWDLAYLSESFQNLTANSSDWYSAKILQKRFKELALSLDLSDHLHLRGVQDRLGLGGDSSSHLVINGR